MSYIVPSGDAIILRGKGGSYVPPSGSSISLRPEPEGLQCAGSATVSFVGTAIVTAAFEIACSSQFKGEVQYRDVAFFGGSQFSPIYPFRHVEFSCGTSTSIKQSSPAKAEFEINCGSSSSFSGVAAAYGRLFEFSFSDVSFVSAPDPANADFGIKCYGKFSPVPLVDHVFSSFGKGRFIGDAWVSGIAKFSGRARAVFASYNPVFSISAKALVDFAPNRSGVLDVHGRSRCTFAPKREHVFRGRSYAKTYFRSMPRSNFAMVSRTKVSFLSARSHSMHIRGYARVRAISL